MLETELSGKSRLLWQTTENSKILEDRLISNEEENSTILQERIFSLEQKIFARMENRGQDVRKLRKLVFEEYGQEQELNMTTTYKA